MVAASPPLRGGDTELTLTDLAKAVADGRCLLFLGAGVHAGPELATLASRVEESLEPLGVAREQRAYMPHITLARIGNKPVHAVREQIANMKNPDFGTFTVSEFHLYSSHRMKPVPPSSAYEILTSFPLGSHS